MPPVSSYFKHNKRLLFLLSWKQEGTGDDTPTVLRFVHLLHLNESRNMDKYMETHRSVKAHTLTTCTKFTFLVTLSR